MQGLIPESVQCEAFRWHTPAGKAEWLWNAARSLGLPWALGRAGRADFCLALEREAGRVIQPSFARPKTGGKGKQVSSWKHLSFGSFQQNSSMCLLSFGCLGIIEQGVLSQTEFTGLGLCSSKLVSEALCRAEVNHDNFKIFQISCLISPSPLSFFPSTPHREKLKYIFF